LAIGYPGGYPNTPPPFPVPDSCFWGEEGKEGFFCCNGEGVEGGGEDTLVKNGFRWGDVFIRPK